MIVVSVGLMCCSLEVCFWLVLWCVMLRLVCCVSIVILWVYLGVRVDPWLGVVYVLWEAQYVGPGVFFRGFGIDACFVVGSVVLLVHGVVGFVRWIKIREQLVSIFVVFPTFVVLLC
jgi:hypothetical protein